MPEAAPARRRHREHPEHSELELRAVGYDHPDAVALVAAVQREYVVRYGGPDSAPLSAAELDPPVGHFLVGYLDGRPVACGGWRNRAADEDRGLRDGDVEIKRMYVAEAMRGRGFARRLLAELERTAAAAGGRRMVLETGIRQPEAIALYQSAGYQPLERFGWHRDSENSRCFAKPLGG
jgi:GNAT superfamily N-acetyltransferase